MQVFISWSQPTSRQIAEILKDELYSFFNEKIEFWFSSTDISAGDVAINSIIDSLQKSDIIITCLDSSNFNKTWIYFETGVIFGRNYNKEKHVVFPIIFDDISFDDFKGTPFTYFQLKIFNKDNLKKILEEINDLYKIQNGDYARNLNTFQTRFKETWNKLNKQINTNIMKKCSKSGSMITTKNIVDKLSHYKAFPAPSLGSVIKYDSGFETNYFYDFLLENAKKRLYIYGRKNKKLGDKTFKDKFKKILDNKIDLKILFLNPNSNYAKDKKAQDIASFKSALIACILDISERFKKNNLDISHYCRMYDEQRASEIIIADEVVFYKDLAYSTEGKPLHFTNESFYITSVDSLLGKKYYDIFDITWNKYKENLITESLLKSLIKTD